MARKTPTAAQDAAHEERLRIIYAPLPQRIRRQVSYPWAGTIVNDTMATILLDKKRVKLSTGERDFDNTPDAIFSGWDNDVEVVEL